MAPEDSLPPLVPRPRESEPRDGAVTVDESVPIVPDESAGAAADRLAAVLEREVGVELDVEPDATGTSPAIAVRREDGDDPESYRIDVDDGGVTLAAPSTAGLEYAARTLAGLLRDRDGSWTVPGCSVRDAPAHEWRGFMIDPARGYIPVDRVKELIDLAARAKLNRFHMHLLDAESSAIEFAEYPELTEPLPEEFHDVEWLQSTGQGRTPAYTDDDVAELVDYAAERSVELVPEIDLPGHAIHALSAYPELRCTVPEGEPSPWTVCAGAEATYEFVDGLVAQLADQFPFEVVHVGGDEFEFDYSWEDCERCRERMDAEGLADTDELFEYFLRRVHGILDSYDRRMMVWNDGIDIADSPDIPRDTLIQFWTIMELTDEGDSLAERFGDAPGRSMARFLEEGFEVVNSYTKAAYIDRQTDAEILLSWTPTGRPRVPEGYEDQVLGGEMPAWSGWEDEGWREYYRRALPSAFPVFGDRVWNGSPIEDRAAFDQGVARHALGPAIPDDFGLYDDLGGVILPVDHDRNVEMADAAASLAGRTSAEAADSYRATIDLLADLLAADAVPYPAAAEAYIDVLEWLVEKADYDARGLGYN